MTLGPVFETGSMAGLMTLFGRHSSVMTNFKIYYPESRPIGARRGLATGAGAAVCGGAWRALECCRDTVQQGYGTGWALAIPINGWVGGTRYTPPGTTQLPAPPGTHAHDPHCHHARAPGHHEHAHMTGLRPTKEILGVDNALPGTEAYRTLVLRLTAPWF